MSPEAVETVLAYAAGIMDGEGCIRINWSIRSGAGFSLTACVSNTKVRLVDWLERHFGGSITVAPRDGNRQPLYKWNLYGAHAASFLRSVYPYLQIKKEEAECALAFYDLIERNRATLHGSDGMTRLLSPSERMQRIDLWWKLRELKRAI